MTRLVFRCMLANVATQRSSDEMVHFSHFGGRPISLIELLICLRSLFLLFGARLKLEPLFNTFSIDNLDGSLHTLPF